MANETYGMPSLTDMNRLRHMEFPAGLDLHPCAHEAVLRKRALVSLVESRVSSPEIKAEFPISFAFWITIMK